MLSRALQARPEVLLSRLLCRSGISRFLCDWSSGVDQYPVAQHCGCHCTAEFWMALGGRVTVSRTSVRAHRQGATFGASTRIRTTASELRVRELEGQQGSPRKGDYGDLLQIQPTTEPRADHPAAEKKRGGWLKFSTPAPKLDEPPHTVPNRPCESRRYERTAHRGL
jgi:hypothetical protein